MKLPTIKWRRVILIALIAVLSFCAGILVSKKVNWRVFVLHDSEKVTIKVK